MACSLVCNFLPADSLTNVALADTGLIVIELSVLVLCWSAYRRTKSDPYRWLWLFMGVWVLGSLLGAGVHMYHEVILRTVVPSPGLADVGFLFSYLAPLALFASFGWRTHGRLHYAENTLDAAVFTLGVASLAWPLVFEKMFTGHQRDSAFWMDLAYPFLDFFIVVTLVSLLFGYYGAHKRRPPIHYLLIGVAFLLQVVGDTISFTTTQAGQGYLVRGWISTLTLLSLSSVAIAALLALRDARTPSLESLGPAPAEAPPMDDTLPTWRALVPYATLPVLAASLSIQISGQDWRWNFGTTVLASMSAAVVFLLVWRQYVALARNRHLYANLADVSQQLKTRVTDLAQMNRRLEHLNDSSHRLTSLRRPLAVARAGLQTACEFVDSPGGWISLGEGADYTVLTHGVVEGLPHADPEVIEDAEQRGVLRVVPLTVRDQKLGTLLLLEAARSEDTADLLPLVAAHLASALDNAGRYEEALRLAERDPLTGLFNHRGIHRRLAGEALRAQQSDSQLSLIMIDLDDFKVLNDTYGHVAGDSVLRQVSDAIGSVLRHADLAGRIGGDELLLVLPNTGAEGAMQLGERLRTALASRPYLTSDGVSIPVYLSLGVATMPDDANSVADLIEVADSNLYTSKQHGGNTTSGSGASSAADAFHTSRSSIAERLLDEVGVRDHYTRRHSEHVVSHALALGDAVGLTEDSLRTLRIAAMLHDVGNLGVPPGLLRRPGPLTPDEENLVRSHVVLGSDLIMDIPRLSEVVDAVSAHHEQYDGSGYPAQSAGEDIPLLGRILAIADAYSAMTLDRPYRQSMSSDEARAELSKSAGSQLDPKLVEVFVRLLEAREYTDSTDAHAVDEATAG